MKFVCCFSRPFCADASRFTPTPLYAFFGVVYTQRGNLALHFVSLNIVHCFVTFIVLTVALLLDFEQQSLRHFVAYSRQPFAADVLRACTDVKALLSYSL